MLKPSPISVCFLFRAVQATVNPTYLDAAVAWKSVVSIQSSWYIALTEFGTALIDPKPFKFGDALLKGSRGGEAKDGGCRKKGRDAHD